MLSRKGQEIAYLGQDGIHVFDRESRSDILIATRDIGEPQKIHWGADDDSLVVGIRGAPRSEQSMFWGAILALKPEAGSMPELLIEGDDIYLADVIPDDDLWLYVGKEMQDEKANDTDPRFPDAGELTCGVQR